LSLLTGIELVPMLVVNCLRMMSVGLLLLVAVGCDNAEKISRLEKQVEELKTQVNKVQAASDFDLQAKCSRDAKGWLDEQWGRGDKDTILLHQTNHYNKSLNKCFVLIEYHFNNGRGNGSWSNNMTVWDVYENHKIAEFLENHMVSLPTYDSSLLYA
jgi:hypothetical protein